MRHHYHLLFIVGAISLYVFSGCQQEEKLPFLGPESYQNDGSNPYQIPSFSLINQDSQTITNETFEGKIYIADFFFTSCPTICPLMTQQMLRIHDHFKELDQIKLISHSIDTKYDTVGQLKTYAENLGVSSDKWHFVTGEKEKIYQLADAYFNIVIEDATLPGGFDHSGRLILVDQNRHVRSFCNGTNKEEVGKLIGDIEKLIDETTG